MSIHAHRPYTASPLDIKRVADAAQLPNMQGPYGSTVRVVKKGTIGFVTRFMRGMMRGKKGYYESELLIHDGGELHWRDWKEEELREEPAWRREFLCRGATFALTALDEGGVMHPESVFLFVSTSGFDIEEIIIRLERHFATTVH